MKVCFRMLMLTWVIGAGLLGLAACANQGADASTLPPPMDASYATPAATPTTAGTMVPVVYEPNASMTASTANYSSLAGQAAVAAPTSPPTAPRSADPWPRDVTVSDADALIYQPQIESWTGNQMAWRVAVALRPAGAKAETFGVLWGSARTEVDRSTRTVSLEDVSVSQIKFPTLPDNGAAYLAGLRQALHGALATIALDSVEASLAASQSVKPNGHAVRNEPPKVIVAYGPALLIPIEGQPVVRAMSDARFERVINTQALIARRRFGDTWFLKLYDGWVSSTSLAGPWTQAGFVPWGLEDASKSLIKAGTVDALNGTGATPKPTLANGVPAIHVTEVPTELIVFKGQPNLVPITGTPLLWATNSATDVLVDTTNNAYYVLLSGRWYRAAGLAGPWSFIASNALPASFKQIPAKGSPASIVLASVAGTPQAQEAVIANSIPQTASVARAGGPIFAPEFDGAPVWQPVTSTSLFYAANARIPVIQVNPSSYYAVQAGVWFSAPVVTGPWVVATTVPEVIYTIPVASPLHYVTYVRVYGYKDDLVYVGYTPGYMGTVVDVGGTVVYGTGYSYSPWIGTVWYGAPVTWGVAAAPVYNPYVGFTYGFGIGLATAAWAEPYWGGAYYHPGYYGYPCCGSASANVYRNWGTGVSSGTRTWYNNAGGSFGTAASGSYATDRGTTGTYNAQRSWNPYTGQGSQGYNRTVNTASGTTGSVNRNETYNAQTGQRGYGSNVEATGAGGSSIDRNVSATAGPQGVDRSASTTTYNANTGQTKTWSDGTPQNTHVAGSDGNVYRSDGSGGWQQHSTSGWGSASGNSAWASQEQQARSTAADRTNSYGGGGWDRSGSGSDSSRYGGGDSWGNRFGGSAGGSGSWDNRFGGGSYSGRFGGGGFRGGGRR
ncbi:MAG TPA: hypothetical protein VLN25_01515 [Burkholderiaceae bacterium]|nr:hypothetical protein [Burkholderiaceae bacterium]